MYWLSTQSDELDWTHSNWYLTPVTQYADLTPLRSLPAVKCEVQATMRREADGNIATITLTVPPASKALALFQHVSIRDAAGGEAVVPILWSDNDVTLWPGESLTLTAHSRRGGTATPVLEVSGWNTPAQTIPLAAQSQAVPASQGSH